MTVLEVGKCISTMESNKSMGLDEINPFLLKLALPYILEALTYNMSVFLDLKKAFGLVNHDILLMKLSLYTENSPSVSIFKSYLDRRSQCVYVTGDYPLKALFDLEFPRDLFLVHFSSVFFCNQ